MNIELVHDADCPNVGKARRALAQALADAGMAQGWTEWVRDDPAAPAHVRRYGSPTILVDGSDVGGTEPGVTSETCRLYRAADGGVDGAPDVHAVAAALEWAAARPKGSHVPGGWRRLLAVLPATGAGFLPVGLCPACWPAYAAVLGPLGLGFVLRTAWLLPLMLLFVGAALVSLGYRAEQRHGYGPLIMGAVGGCLLVTGKFWLGSSVLTYGGQLLFLAAAVWNVWPRRAVVAGSCPACAGEGHVAGSNT